jgi:hypothetical protein
LDKSKGTVGWTGGLDKSKGTMGWTGGLDKFKMALDVRPHWRCGQMDYTKICVVHEWKTLCIGELITPTDQ